MASSPFDIRTCLAAIVAANHWNDVDGVVAGVASDDVDGAVRSLRASGLDSERLADVEAILRAQERLPGYELTRLIEHADGDGLVFAGRHVASRSSVAVTVMSWSEPTQLRRFQREARQLTSLRHPHVARVVDAGEAKGRCHLAVELVDAPTLESVIQHFRDLKEASLVELVRQLALGLGALAQAGVVHRLVTPAIMRVPRAWLSGAASAASRIVDPGILRGVAGSRRQADSECPEYLAPEQVRGQSTDQRTLVYNLGAILYHALAGAPPFAGSSPELVRKAHLFEEVPDLACLLPDLGDETRRLVSNAMRKAPAERHAGLAAFVSACDHALRRLGVVVSPVETAIAPADEATGATVIVPVLGDDPFAAADAAASAADAADLAASSVGPEAQSIANALDGAGAGNAREAAASEMTTRILAKHAALKASRGGISPAQRAKPVVTQSFLAGPAPRMDVVMGIIVGNGWVPPEGQQQLREFFRANASALVLRMRGGISNLLVTRGILTPDLARELDRTIADQTLFPHYRLMRLLGEGPVGRSYVALDIASGDEVCFKVFRQPDGVKRQRFLDEFASFTRLRDPHVAAALACGANGEACFAATALVDGETLSKMMAGRRALPEAYAVGLVQQMLSGLAHVHERTARPHLTLKPENVLIMREPGDRRVFAQSDFAVLSDFGMSEHIPAYRTVDVAWRAPEQSAGAPGDLRSDFHVLGAMLHRMIVGSPRGTGDDTCDPGTHVKGLHPLTREAVVTASRRDPDRRYQDHASFQAVLAQAARELAQDYAIEPQIVRDGPPERSMPVSTRVLRRHHAAGPKGDAGMRGAKSPSAGLELRTRRPADP